MHPSLSGVHLSDLDTDQETTFSRSDAALTTADGTVFVADGVGFEGLWVFQETNFTAVEGSARSGFG